MQGYKQVHIMNITGTAVIIDFKIWMVASLGLIKDNRMGANKGRAKRIKTARAYVRKGNC